MSTVIPPDKKELPQEPHHLDNNDLIEGTRWLAERGRRFVLGGLIGLLVILLGALGYTYKVNQDRQHLADAWATFFANNSPDQFEELILRYPGTPVIPLAKLRLGDLRFQEGKTRLVTDRGDAINKIDLAIDQYRSLADDLNLPPEIREQAQIGLVKAVESKGALADTKAELQKIIESTPDTPVGVFAKEYLKVIDAPEAKEFYESLAAYKPIAPSPDLPLPGGGSPFGGANNPFGTPEPSGTLSTKQAPLPPVMKKELPNLEVQKVDEKKGAETKPVEVPKKEQAAPAPKAEEKTPAKKGN